MPCCRSRAASQKRTPAIGEMPGLRSRRLADGGPCPAALTTRTDIEHISSTLVATTDPTARRQLVELDRALARLSAEQREVLLLVGLEGMDYESVAQILDVPIGTVRSRLSRGRERLRELMGRDRRPQSDHSP